VVIFGLVLFQTGMVAAIEIREGGAAGLKVDFGAVKPVFQKAEAINFKIKANRDFFLYLFSIDKASNKGYLLLPNDKQPDNYFRANREYTLPRAGIEFFSDKAGTEKVVMVASTEKLSIETSQYSKAGAFFTGSDTEMEQSIKAIRVREGAANKQVIKEIDLVIIGN
jgi:hypothetical protein